MSSDPNPHNDLIDWVDALENLVLFDGKDSAKEVVKGIISHAKNKGLLDESRFSLPFENSISHFDEIPYPGDWNVEEKIRHYISCLLYTSPSPRDRTRSRMPSSA